MANTLISDTRVLNAIGRKLNIEFDSKFKYCTSAVNTHPTTNFEYKGSTYRLKYMRGCFNPFVFRVLNY